MSNWIKQPFYGDRIVECVNTGFSTTEVLAAVMAYAGARSAAGADAGEKTHLVDLQNALKNGVQCETEPGAYWKGLQYFSNATQGLLYLDPKEYAAAPKYSATYNPFLEYILFCPQTIALAGSAFETFCQIRGPFSTDLNEQKWIDFLRVVAPHRDDNPVGFLRECVARELENWYTWKLGFDRDQFHVKFVAFLNDRFRNGCIISKSVGSYKTAGMQLLDNLLIVDNIPQSYLRALVDTKYGLDDDIFGDFLNWEDLCLEYLKQGFNEEAVNEILAKAVTDLQGNFQVINLIWPVQQ